MANVDPSKASSSSQSNEEAKKDTLEIHIKTLDSQIYTFRVENDMPIAQLKEKIASATSVPIGQQRLIFRGRVLKDDHALSDYHVEDGHTLHLVARQPVQPQTQSGTNSNQPSNQNGNRGSDVGEGTQRTRIGHSVVVGLNVTDQGEGAVADISRIVGAVLNSIGAGIANNTLASGNSPSGVGLTTLPLAAQGVETGGQIASGGVQTGNQPQNPLTSPLLRQMVIPDSLTTLNSYMTRMEQTLSLHTGNAVPSQAALQENTNPGLSGYPNIDALITVIDRAQRLLSGPGAAALRHLTENLERERTSSELAVRGQVQAEAMHVGVAMQHLGSLLLELGRTVSTVRMGEPPAEPVVISGPAVYINASGPNPLMVQPNSQNPTPIFGIPSLAPLVNIGVPEQVVLGDAARNISIHVHSANSAAAGMPVGSTPNAGDVARGQPANHGLPIINIGTQAESGAAQVLPAGTVIAAIPSRSRTVTGGSQGISAISSSGSSVQASGLGSSPSVAGIVPHTAIVNVEGLRLSGSNLQFLGNRSQRDHDREVSQPVSSSSDASMPAVSAAAPSGNVGPGPSAHVLQPADGAGDMGSSASEVPNASSSRVSEQNSHSNGTVTADGLPGESLTDERVPTSSSIDGKNHLDGQAIQPGDSDSMHASGSNTRTEAGGTVPLGLGLGGLQPMRRVKKMASRGNNAVHSAGSSAAENEALIAKGQEVLQSLVSQSPGQKQGISSTSQGSTQQVGDQSANVGGMFSGMLQQMMPAVSQMLGIGQSSGSQRNNGGIMSTATRNQGDLQDALQRIAQHDSAGNIFRAVLEAACRLHGEHNTDSFIEVLGNDEELASEFVEMLHRHLHQRLQSGSGSGSGSS